MVKKGASERFDEILIEGRDLISREDFLKYIRSNFEFEKHIITPRLFHQYKNFWK